MARLLHLSDLHLTSNPAAELIADSKSGAVPVAQQARISGRITTTLQALANAVEADGLGLDCIVISGDVVNHDPSAYSLLPSVLAPLVPSIVPAGRVVIVPGNHDVLRGSGPSTPERYKAFATLRSFGYLTPYLEGVDIDDDGRTLAAHDSPTLVAEDGSFAIVALNSANLCQTVEQQDPRPKAIKAENSVVGVAAKILSGSATARDQDIAWIGEGQFLRTSEALQEALPEGSPIRIAVLHHQLLPVGPNPEIKAYESILNLGALLEWIASNEIDLTLHGHKHADRVQFMSGGDAADVRGSIRRTLVVSAPQAGVFDNQNRPFGRLISIDGPAPRTGGIRLQEVYPAGAGGSIKIENLPEDIRCLDGGVGLGVIEGRTAQEVHNKLLTLSGRYANGRLPLVCRIEDGPSALSVPDNYPDTPTDQNPQEWFSKTVSWWQQKRAGRAADFNHGQRLLAYGSIDPDIQRDGTDQIQAAAEALRSKPESSRAIALLVDPASDLANDTKRFPAFVLVQFQIANDRLDTTAYFRKQEMPHWWPINVGELAHLQAQVVDALASLERHVKPGSITTVTALPVDGGSVPKVAVPDLDIRADSSAGMLDLVLPLVAAARPSDEVFRQWRDAFFDWAPSEKAPTDGDPLPLYGLQELLAVLSATIEITRSTGAILTLKAEIHLLHKECEVFEAKEERVRRGARVAWRAKVLGHISTIQELVAEVVAVRS